MQSNGWKSCWRHEIQISYERYSVKVLILYFCEPEIVHMKKIFFTILLAAGLLTAGYAQTDSTVFPEVDKSPMDMSYCPVNYPVLKISEKTSLAPLVRVIYGRPRKNDRIIFGDLVEYGKVWRLGANEATEIEFYKDVTIDNKKIKKGRYTLYAIPDSSNWTIIINKDTDTWGAFKYNSTNDIARVVVPVINMNSPVETLSMTFAKFNEGYNLIVAWDTAEVMLPIVLK
ncbi:MAG: hypothetical protein JWM28_787 [Chitinophagaceae bacterium]|nr:hypothetical protein [Chitinophagaceae bacterium]